MTENEIITQEAPQMQLFSQLMEGILKKLERYCATARPMLGGEVYLTGEEVCSQLRLSTRTLQENGVWNKPFEIWAIMALSSASPKSCPILISP